MQWSQPGTGTAPSANQPLTRFCCRFSLRSSRSCSLSALSRCSMRERAAAARSAMLVWIPVSKPSLLAAALAAAPAAASLQEQEAEMGLPLIQTEAAAGAGAGAGTAAAYGLWCRQFRHSGMARSNAACEGAHPCSANWESSCASSCRGSTTWPSSSNTTLQYNTVRWGAVQQ